jgi:hypothetical protein
MNHKTVKTRRTCNPYRQNEIARSTNKRHKEEGDSIIFKEEGISTISKEEGDLTTISREVEDIIIPTEMVIFRGVEEAIMDFKGMAGGTISADTSKTGGMKDREDIRIATMGIETMETGATITKDREDIRTITAKDREDMDQIVHTDYKTDQERMPGKMRAESIEDPRAVDGVDFKSMIDEYAQQEM